MANQDLSPKNSACPGDAVKKPWSTPVVIHSEVGETNAPIEIVGVPDSKDPFGMTSLNS